MDINKSIIKNKSKILPLLTVAFIIFYTIAALTVSLNRYWQSQFFYFDFGVVDQAIWEVAHFKPPMIDHYDVGISKISILGTHFYPSLFLLSPLYWITDKREILLIYQSLSVGLAALIAYKLACEKIKSQLAILALIFAFLGYVGLQYGLISEFHDAVLIVLPLMVLFYAISRNKWPLYFLMLFIILGFKETFAGLGIGLGLYLVIKKINRKIGIASIVISVVWLVIAVKVIIPFFAGKTAYLYLSNSLPSNPLTMIKQFFLPLEKTKTIFYSYLTFGFLPIFDLSLLPAIFENFFERFVMSDSTTRWGLGFHYNAPLSPLLFMAGLTVFGWLEKRKRLSKIVRIYALFLIFIVLILHRFVLRGPLGLFYNPAFYEQNNRVNYLNNFEKHFPKTGIIMTQNDIALRLSHQDVRLLRRYEDYKIINPDTIIFNLTPGQNPNSFTPLTYEQAVDLKNLLVKDNNYRLEKYGDELYLFKKVNFLKQ